MAPTGDVGDLVVRLVLGQPGCGNAGDGARDGVALEYNAPEALPFEGAGVQGHVTFIQRPHPEPQDWQYAKHFQNRLRRFEFRLQCKFLVDPGQDVFFGVEFPEAIHLSWPLKMTVKWIMTIVHMLCTERGVSYSYCLEKTVSADGGTIWPHLSFPMFAADAIIQTPSGEAPPLLSGSFEKTPTEEKRRVILNTKDTYTFAYWSKNADFRLWEICNLPLGWSSSFCNFIGDLPVHLTAYSLERGSASGGQHAETNKRYLMALVLSNKRVACSKTTANGDAEADASTRVESGALESGTRRLANNRPGPPLRWSHELAEMSPEELEAVWFHTPTRVSETRSSTSRAGLFSSFGICCTADRQSLR